MKRPKEQLCTFLLGDLTFGVEVNQIHEVLRFQPMTRVPLTRAVVAGLINLRGQIVTALEMRERFGLDARRDGPAPLIVVVRSEDGPVALIVDDVGDVIDIDRAQVEDPPSTLRGTVKELVRSVLKHEHGLILILDVARVVAPGQGEEGEAA